MNHRDDDANSAARDIPAEQAVLGGMLLRSDVINEVTALVRPADFYEPRHGEIFEAITALYAAGQPVDAVTVTRQLADRIGRIGGAPYLHTCMAQVPVAANAGYYAHLVRTAARLRAINTMGVRLSNLRVDADEMPEAYAQLHRWLADLEADAPDRYAPLAIDAVPAVLDAYEKPDNRPVTARTGLIDLDEKYKLRAGRVTIFAARPGGGKSLMGVGISRATAIGMGTPTLLHSLEMPTEELVSILVCAEARVDRGRAERGEFGDEEWARIARAVERIGNAPLRIDQTPRVGLDDIRANVDALQRGPGCGLLIVDYLGLMRLPRAASRQEGISEVSAGFKELAKDFEIPVVVLAQLNREPERRTTKVPQVSDLRDSGSLEQDADGVILLHRPDEAGEERRSGEVDLIVGKHRGGPRFTATCAFQGHLGRISSMMRAASWQSAVRDAA